MKAFLGCCLFLLFAARAQTKPQITKLFPVQELVTYHQQVSNEVKPLDKFLGKLRATYNFVFRKPDNTSNVEKILAEDAPNPDLEALKVIWTSQTEPTTKADRNLHNLNDRLYGEPKPFTTASEDRFNDIQPLEPLAPLELQDEAGNTKPEDDVELLTPRTPLQLPVTLGRHLVEWIGSLLGLTFDVYAKLARVIQSS